MNRRAFTTTAPLALLLSGCGTNTTLTPAQVVADAQGIVTGLGKAFGIVIAEDPALIPPAQAATDTAGLNVASGALATIAANLPPVTTGQTLLQTVEKYINAALDDAAAVTPKIVALVPALAPALPLIQAASVLVPVIEAFINPAAPATAARAMAGGMTVAQARALLGVVVR